MGPQISQATAQTHRPDLINRQEACHPSPLNGNKKTDRLPKPRHDHRLPNHAVTFRNPKDPHHGGICKHYYYPMSKRLHTNRKMYLVRLIKESSHPHGLRSTRYQSRSTQWPCMTSFPSFPP